MKHYPKHIGDWIKKTAHLSLLEKGIYGCLLDWYYDEESPLPADQAKICRKIRAAEPNEQAAVAVILDEFFELHEDGWHQDRCDQEIEKYQHSADQNRENGRRGGRPRKAETNPEETQEKPTGLFSLTETKGNQEPRTNNQEPVKESSTDVDVSAPSLPPTPHQDIVALYNHLLARQGLTAVKPNLWAGTRAKALASRWREDPKRQTLDWWRGWFEYIGQSDFLMGRTPKPFKTDLGWLVTHGNFVKVCEGKYHV